MRITDLKCAVIGDSPVLRIVTDEGIDGWGQIESSKPYARAQLPFYKPLVIGQDPTNVARVMLQIRRFGAFKPWGAMVSAIELALWDVAGKAAGVPVYKLLGGKVRDRVRVYNGGVRFKLEERTPEGYGRMMAKMKAAPEGFRIIKQAVGFHGAEPFEDPDFMYDEGIEGKYYPNRGAITERTLNRLVECVEAMKDALGSEVGLALDCGPGWTVPDAIRFARALEPLNLMWLEDLIAGDYTPYTMADAFREVTRATTTPTHTGEQIYLRQNFRELIEKQAVRIVGPDPLDVGGLAEIKWIAEYADLHGVQMAPHGILDGLIGLAGHVHAAAAMPQNFIGFEYPVAKPSWWYDIVEGLPDPIVRDGAIEVWDRPGLGIELNAEKARPYLLEEDRDFFD